MNDFEFKSKYKSGKIGQYLINNYFKAVSELLKIVPEATKKGQCHEIGCGPGESTSRLLNILPKKAKFSASEFLSTQIPEAKKMNPQVNIFQEDVYNLKSSDNYYDLIFFLEVLEHLEDPIQALKEIKRTIKLNSYLILGVPREPIWCICNMLRLKYIKSFGNTPGHINHWSTKKLKELLEQQGFQIVALRQPLPWTIVLAKNVLQ